MYPVNDHGIVDEAGASSIGSAAGSRLIPSVVDATVEAGSLSASGSKLIIEGDVATSSSTATSSCGFKEEDTAVSASMIVDIKDESVTGVSDAEDEVAAGAKAAVVALAAGSAADASPGSACLHS